MGRIEALTNPSPPGAGRVRDLTWPNYTTAGANSLPNLRCRITGAAFGGLLSNFGAPAAQWTFYQGMDCYQMQSSAGAGTGGSMSWLNNANINVRTSPLNVWPSDDDWNVHRIVWIGAISGSIVTDNDMGIQLLSSTTAADGILKTPQNGFGFRFATGGRFNFLTRNIAKGLTEITLATGGVGGYQPTDFHAYEMRILSALPNKPAQLKIFIDNIFIQSIPWSAGTLPANGETSSGMVGFFPTFICNASSNAGTTGLFAKSLAFQAGPTELGVL